MLQINSTLVQKLFNVHKSIRCFDVNISMDKAAIVDDENKCSFFDMRSKKLLFQVKNEILFSNIFIKCLFCILGI